MASILYALFMKKYLLLPVVFFSVWSIGSSYGATISIVSPWTWSTSTGIISTKVSIEALSESWFLDCTMRKTVPARKILFATGFVITPSQTWASFEIDGIWMKLNKGDYILGCKVYNLNTNALMTMASSKFRLKPPPPIVYFATTPGNLIRNPTFEDKNGELPAYWKRGWFGRNEYTQDHLFTGLVGKRSLRTTITNYISWDVKWYFQDIAALGGKTYIYAQKYHTTAPAKLTVRYTMKDGSYQYDELQTLPVTEWPYASTRVYFITPKNTVGLTVWTALSSEGSITIDDPLLLLSPASE